MSTKPPKLKYHKPASDELLIDQGAEPTQEVAEIKTEVKQAVVLEKPAAKPVPVAQPVVKKIGKYPFKPAKPIFERAVCIITKDVNGVRIVIKSIVVPSTKTFFRVGEHTFYVDVNRAMFFSRKGAYLMFDMDISEPLETSTVVGTVPHLPVELGDNAHYSQNVDLVIHGQVIKQALAAVGGESKFNWMWVIMLAVGAMMGFGMGMAFAPSILHLVPQPTSTTAAKELVKMMIGVTLV